MKGDLVLRNLMPQSTQPLFAMCSSFCCSGYEGVLGKIHTKIHTGSFVFRIAGKKGKDALVFSIRDVHPRFI